ncbi:hypothetical protein AB9X29_003764 [Vibrio vulnificus]
MDKTLKLRMVMIGGAVAIALIMLLDEPDPMLAEAMAEAKKSSEQVASHKENANEALVSTAQCDDILRVVAPDASNFRHELLLAARLLKGASDKEYAMETIKLQKARDLAITQAELWDFKAKEAKSREAHGKAMQTLNEIDKGTYSVNSGTIITGESIEPNGDTQESTLPVYDLKLRFKGMNLASGEMLFQRGDEWFRNVRSGQFIDNVQIGEYDRAIGCVSISIDGRQLPQKLCTN